MTGVEFGLAIFPLRRLITSARLTGRIQGFNTGLEAAHCHYFPLVPESEKSFNRNSYREPDQFDFDGGPFSGCACLREHINVGDDRFRRFGPATRLNPGTHFVDTVGPHALD